MCVVRDSFPLRLHGFGVGGYGAVEERPAASSSVVRTELLERARPRLLAVALSVLFFWLFALALAALLNVGLEYVVFSLQGR